MEEPKRVLQADERRPQTIVQNSSTMPATPPTASTPRLELSGTLVSTANSPKGDIRVEYRSDGHVYLIDRSDEAKRFLFHTYTQIGDAVLFSPDEQWLILNNSPNRVGGSVKLFSRVRGNDVEYIESYEPTSGRPLSTALWKFYLSEVNLPEATSQTGIGITGATWETDSPAVRFRVDGFDPEGLKIVPQTYECNYDFDRKRFNGITAPSYIRSMIAKNASVTQPSYSPIESASPVVQVSIAPASTPEATAPPVMPGERFPQTRLQVLSASELQGWQLSDLQYAINEILARNGAEFPDKATAGTFRRFSWYHPQKKRDLDKTEASLPELEKTNFLSLG